MSKDDIAAPPRIGDSHVVRRLASNMTHVAVVTSYYDAKAFGAPYYAIPRTTAACGVTLSPGSVIMRPGTTTKCRACVHLTGITEEGDR